MLLRNAETFASTSLNYSRQQCNNTRLTQHFSSKGHSAARAITHQVFSPGWLRRLTPAVHEKEGQPSVNTLFCCYQRSRTVRVRNKVPAGC
eukprot:1149766-Pelagomonas_calceolata.AAC.11